MWEVQWNDGDPHQTESLEQLNRVLDELAESHSSQNPVLVQIQSPKGEVMMLGIGGALSVLNYIASGGWPAKHSLGERSASGTINYRMGSYDSEMPASYAVPYGLARNAVEHFFVTGQLLRDIIWEED